jgi:hypothetical protein
MIGCLGNRFGLDNIMRRQPGTRKPGMERFKLLSKGQNKGVNVRLFDEKRGIKQEAGKEVFRSLSLSQH